MDSDHSLHLVTLNFWRKGMNYGVKIDSSQRVLSDCHPYQCIAPLGLMNMQYIYPHTSPISSLIAPLYLCGLDGGVEDDK